MFPVVLQIKNTLRNRRFVFFTIFFPVAFFLFFIKQFRIVVTADPGMIALFYAMFGIAGSGLNSFSQRIASQRGYYRIADRISPYSYARFMTDSVLAQTFLNALILLSVTAAALVFAGLKPSLFYLCVCGLLLYEGLFYILVGFLLGTVFASETLASASFPVYAAFMSLNITPNMLSGASMPGFIIAAQKFFPGYWCNCVFADNSARNVLTALSVITAHMVILAVLAVLANKKLKTAEK